MTLGGEDGRIVGSPTPSPSPPAAGAVKRRCQVKQGQAWLSAGFAGRDRLVSAFEIHDVDLSAEACDAVEGRDDAPSRHMPRLGAECERWLTRHQSAPSGLRKASTRWLHATCAVRSVGPSPCRVSDPPLLPALCLTDLPGSQLPTCVCVATRLLSSTPLPPRPSDPIRCSGLAVSELQREQQANAAADTTLPARQSLGLSFPCCRGGLPDPSQYGFAGHWLRVVVCVRERLRLLYLCDSEAPWRAGLRRLATGMDCTMQACPMLPSTEQHAPSARGGPSGQAGAGGGSE